MDKTEFESCMIEQVAKFNIEINKEQLSKLYIYMQLLLEWNEKMNLTAITNEKEIITKHFIDSLTLLEHIKGKEKIIDVGTGAGFPGIPLKIMLEKNAMTLLDSLNKRITFLEECKNKINLKNLELIHGRAEDFGNNTNYRENYDVVVSRAVAPLNVLLEYTIPFLKVGGSCICMKGPKIEEEIQASKNTIKELGITIQEIKEFSLSNENQRTLAIIRKERKTKRIYPRKFANIKKNPL